MATLNQPIDVIFFNSKPMKKEDLMTTTTTALNFPADKPMSESPLWAYCEKHRPSTFIDALSGFLNTPPEDLLTLGISEQQVNTSKTIYDHFWRTKHHKPTNTTLNETLELLDIERQSIELYDDKKRLEWLFSNASISLIEKGTGADWWTELNYGDPRNNIDQAMNRLK